MSKFGDTGLLICVSGDGPRHDLYFHYDLSRFTLTAALAIVKAVIAEAHRMSQQAEDSDIADYPSVQELIESRLAQVGIEAVEPSIAPVWDELSVDGADGQASLAQTLIDQGLPEMASALDQQYEMPPTSSDGSASTAPISS